MNLKHFIFVTFFLFFLTCTSQKKEAIESNSITVFIHGVKGSLLYREKNIVWLNASQAFNIRQENISSPITWENKIQTTDDIKVDGIFRKMNMIPGILSTNVYELFLVEFENKFGQNFLTFNYDWRRDNNETVLIFEKYIDDLKKQNPNKKINLISHSNGGLISLALIHKRPDLIDKTVFVSVPFKGTISFLEEQHYTKPTGFNSNILSKEVLFSFPSFYSLLPEKISYKKESNISSEFEANLFDPEFWIKNKFGIFQEEKNHTEENKFHLKESLNRAKEFKDKLKLKKMNYPKTLFITSKAFPTITKLEYKLKGWAFITSKDSGDDRVTAESSIIEEIPHEVFLSKYNHSSLLNDSKAIVKIFDFLK